jgi:D-arabinose 1-dehydrogenase-like Zn-dependent alcohol dehydrogenase
VEARARVGIVWLGSYCGYCESCRAAASSCANQLISGLTMDGGYQDYVLSPFEALALIPDELSAVEAVR